MTLLASSVVASFPGRPPVLRGASLTLEPGRRVALLGANGSGKTTLLRCLSGMHRPSSGQVSLDGQPLAYGRAALREHRRRVQLVLQDPDDQLFSADVVGDVSFGPVNLGLPEAEVRARVAEALELLGVTHLAERPTHQLSYGERKRVATAGAVAMRPDYLLLDEPTAGLDPRGVHEMTDALARLSALGTTIAIATHDVPFALQWADEVAIVADGKLTQGAPTEVLADTHLLSDAHLERPWPLELAARLGLPGRPRNLAEVSSLVLSHRTTA